MKNTEKVQKIGYTGYPIHFLIFPLDSLREKEKLPIIRSM